MTLNLTMILRYDTKVMGNKREKDTIGFMKTSEFCTLKGTTNRVKRQPKEWEKIFASHLYDKGLISEYTDS